MLIGTMNKLNRPTTSTLQSLVTYVTAPQATFTSNWMTGPMIGLRPTTYSHRKIHLALILITNGTPSLSERGGDRSLSSKPVPGIGGPGICSI